MNLLRSLVKSDLRIFGLVLSAIMLVVAIQAVRQGDGCLTHEACGMTIS